jgi:hypothetical protein
MTAAPLSSAATVHRIFKVTAFWWSFDLPTFVRVPAGWGTVRCTPRCCEESDAHGGCRLGMSDPLLPTTPVGNIP